MIIPLLVLLATRQKARLVVLLSFFAIFPDFDSIFGPHRMVLHNIFVIVLIPLAFLLFARFKRPELLLPGMIATFFLSSHILLDLDGVAFFYPIDPTAYMFIPHIDFITAPDFHFNFYLEWGAMNLPQKTEYNMLPSISIAYIFFLVLIFVNFKKEIKGAAGKLLVRARALLSKFVKMLRPERAS